MPPSITYNEQELVVALQNKSEHAFQHLYDNYSAVLLGVIFKMLNDREQSQDLLQEVFTKIWQNLHRYDADKGRLYTWMINIARNHTLDWVRSKGYKKQKQILGDENSVTRLGTQANASAIVEAKLVAGKLQRLDPSQKQVLELAYFSGYTQDEIAQELGIPLGTVKSRVRSALIVLRKLLGTEIER